MSEQQASPGTAPPPPPPDAPGLAEQDPAVAGEVPAGEAPAQEAGPGAGHGVKEETQASIQPAAEAPAPPALQAAAAGEPPAEPASAALKEEEEERAAAPAQAAPAAVNPKEEGAAPKQEAAADGGAEPPTDEALVARLRQLLAEVDLATTTEKQLRRRLESEYGVGLADRKALLRDEINAYLEAGSGGEEEAEEEAEKEEPSGARKRKSSGSSLGSYLSPEMQEFLGVERLPRTQVVKRIWEYVKAKGLQDPKDKRQIVFDDALKVLFPGTRCSMFKLQKHLSKHCKTSDVVGGSDDDEEEEGEEGEEAEAEQQQQKRARPAAKSSSRRRSCAGGDGEKKKAGGFTKECRLSDELAAWVGRPTASRPDVSRHFWAYVKEKGLQDPSDKSFILSDDVLLRLTGEARFKGFGFNKYLKPHIIGYAD